MLLTLNDIKEVFNNLIKEKITREQADRWAYERMQSFDADTLYFEPKEKEELLWDAIQYLYGIDSKVSPTEYMHPLDEIKETFEERWAKE